MSCFFKHQFHYQPCKLLFDRDMLAGDDWQDGEADAFSFDDSERFEEDSLCSWLSEPESLTTNWTGWAASTTNNALSAPNAPGTSLGFAAASVTGFPNLPHVNNCNNSCLISTFRNGYRSSSKYFSNLCYVL